MTNLNKLKEGFQWAADLLETLPPHILEDPDSLKFTIWYLPINTDKGSSACIGGWLAYLISQEGIKMYNFLCGEDALARRCGFMLGPIGLEKFFSLTQNQWIWGEMRNNGRGLFSSRESYIPQGEEDRGVALRDIIIQFRKVTKNIEQFSNQKSISL